MYHIPCDTKGIKKGAIILKRMLKQYRENNDLTQNDLAEKVGIATVTIRKIENGQRNPSNKTARKISLILGRTMDEVFPDIFLLSSDTKSIKSEMKH